MWGIAPLYKNGACENKDMYHNMGGWLVITIQVWYCHKTSECIMTSFHTCNLPAFAAAHGVSESKSATSWPSANQPSAAVTATFLPTARPLPARRLNQMHSPFSGFSIIAKRTMDVSESRNAWKVPRKPKLPTLQGVRVWWDHLVLHSGMGSHCISIQHTKQKAEIIPTAAFEISTPATCCMLEPVIKW